MPRSPAQTPPSSGARAPGPGRPKDLGKREAILEAGKRIFTQRGYEGTSMDEIAAAAGVSKLTVYSHFGDKQALFGAVVKSHCESGLPSSLFDPSPGTPLRERLLTIARAFYAMITSPEAVAGHRMLCSPQVAGSPLSQLFWEAGPQRVHAEFAALLRRRIAAGELEIPGPGDDAIERASAQFFALLKGEPHARMVFGCCSGGTGAAVAAHVEASVDLFLRAYAPQALPTRAAPAR